jgi:alpha-D-xyloside xylohydrolase
MAWMTTDRGYTPMRALAMDFRTDVRAANIGDQFMYGPALLVSPVTEPSAATRRMYLPAGKWYDFWSGTMVDGAREIDSPSPLDRIPLHVRAGSIVAMGPDEEWSTQKPADPIELRIYAGANGDFTFYEDENDNYDYEKGAYATIPLHWDDAQHTLIIGSRRGGFPGMLPSRTFDVVFAGDSHGTGIEPTKDVDHVVHYKGTEVRIVK